MTPTTRDKLEFVHAMARHTNATVRQCEALMRYASTLQRLAEAACNGYDSIEEQSRDRDKQSRIQRKVTDLLMSITGSGENVLCISGACCEPIFQNGAVLKICVPSGYSNSFGGEGIVVPA